MPSPQPLYLDGSRILFKFLALPLMLGNLMHSTPKHSPLPCMNHSLETKASIDLQPMRHFFRQCLNLSNLAPSLKCTINSSSPNHVHCADHFIQPKLNRKLGRSFAGIDSQ